MQEYLNKNCAECGEKFTETDDIAVCPDCGTPVHRSCWNGHCPNETKHAEGFDWDKAQSNSESANTHSAEGNICSICKNTITDRAVHCPDCGEPMHLNCFLKEGACPNRENHDGSYFDEESLHNEDGTPRIYINSFDSFADKIMKHPVRDRNTGEPLTCHGVTQAELVHFLGKDYISTPRYMGIFMRMAMTGKKAFFNLWAGLFMPYYQFYQKMIGPGLVLLMLSFVLSVPQLMWQTEFLMTGASASAEAPVAAPMADLINILSFVSLGIQILLAFFGDYMYMRWTVHRILSLRDEYKELPEGEYYEILEKKGNPKWYFTLLGLGFSLLFSYAFTVLFIG